MLTFLKYTDLCIWFFDLEDDLIFGYKCKTMFHPFLYSEISDAINFLKNNKRVFTVSVRKNVKSLLVYILAE